MAVHSVGCCDTMSMTTHSIGPQWSFNTELVTSAAGTAVRGGNKVEQRRDTLHVIKTMTWTMVVTSPTDNNVSGTLTNKEGCVQFW